MQKNIICDSSALISLADTCNIGALAFLTQLGIRFYITPGVKDEIINRPLTIRKYAFSAARLQKNVNDNTLRFVTSTTLHQQTQKILETANHMIRVDKKPLELLQLGEAECIAAFASVSADALLIDEKTTRMLIENPYKFRETIAAEYKQDAALDTQKRGEFEEAAKGITCMRSAELLAYAYRKGFFDEYKENRDTAFKASVYSLREAGCSLTSTEILEYEALEF